MHACVPPFPSPQSRIGIRLLISQHLAIHHPVGGYIGTIATSISPIGVVRDAISDAARVCEREYGWAPDVDIVGAEEVQVNFVPNHLHHIVFELMKNSMRAVLEHHGVANYDAPPIQVVLTDDEREFAIRAFNPLLADTRQAAGTAVHSRPPLERCMIRPH